MSAAWVVLVLLVSLAITQVAVLATSIYLHRALAHRSLRLHPLADMAFRIAAVADDGAEPAAVGGGASQASHLHRPRG